MRRVISWPCIGSPLYHLYRLSEHLNTKTNLNSKVISVLELCNADMAHFVLF